MAFPLKLKRKSFYILLLLGLGLIVLAAGRILFYIRSPQVIFLSDRAGAHWIKCDDDFRLEIRPAGLTRGEFRHVFTSQRTIVRATVTFQALKSARVFMDGREIFFSGNDLSQWKKIHVVSVPFPIQPGLHEIRVLVTSSSSPPALIAYSRDIPIGTNREWLASCDGKSWKKAAIASRIQPPPNEVHYPSTGEGLISVSPLLMSFFAVVMGLLLWTDKRPVKWLAGLAEPRLVKWIFMFLWMILSLNNMFKLNYQVGTDGWGHIEYIDYIVTKGSLPLAHEGWHMFQAPLYYLLSAPLYGFLMRWLDLPAIVKALAVIPIVCGAVQIEIAFRVARRVFVERKDLQIVALMVAVFFPMHIYTYQYAGNEPLAACLISIVILLCMPLVMPPPEEYSNRHFVCIGVFWGLAVLSKITALLLAPVLIFVIAFYTDTAQKPMRFFLGQLLSVFGIASAISGWYFVRNWVKLGNPFAGVFETLDLLQWWQDPGFRTWSHLWSFGQVLSQPIYAGVTSFWDMFYATLWLDGINSGMIDFIPWNENFMVAGAILGLFPTFALFSGIALGFRKGTKNRHPLLFSAGIIVLFLMAMMDMYVMCPFYSRTKASYTLGLLPCYAILIAAGIEPLLRKKVLRSLALAFLSSWAFAAYVAYFVVKFQ